MARVIQNTDVIHRFHLFHRTLSTGNGIGHWKCIRKYSDYSKVTIDGITKKIHKPKDPEFVPQNFCKFS